MARAVRVTGDEERRVEVSAAQEGDHCMCDAQFLNGAWWIRMRGLGHTHKPSGPPAVSLNSA